MSKILVIEDDTSFRSVLMQMLVKAGYEVMEASNGDQALKLCPMYQPDLVLTDIIMPDKEGLETIREMIALCPEIKIVAMSGGGRIGPDSYLPLAKMFGAKATLQKPFMREELLTTIEQVLNSKD